jgi:hypothetical protein
LGNVPLRQSITKFPVVPEKRSLEQVRLELTDIIAT